MIRHRLHCGGNRQLNAALHRIAVVQAQWDPAAQAFLARKRAEGEEPPRGPAGVKRHLANVVYRALHAWAQRNLPPLLT